MLDNLLQEAAQARSAGDNKQAALLYEQVAKICAEDQSQSEHMAFCCRNWQQYIRNKAYMTGQYLFIRN